MISLDNILAKFKPIGLKEMDAVALMNRTDTKFLASKQVVETVLTQLEDVYQVLEMSEKRMFKYRTVYFDTTNKDLLYDHLRGKLNRVKVRSREYVGSAKSFFEVKLKTNKGKTVKSRIPKITNLNSIETDEAEFLHSVSSLKADMLQPVVEVSFNRTTLVSLEHKERVTFDFELEYSSKGEQKLVEDLVIVELKRDSFASQRSPVLTELKQNSVYPSSLSKYCLGMILLDETKKYNRYKPKLLKLNKLSTHGNIW